MPSTPALDRLRVIKSLPQLAAYLRDELDWPIESDDVENISFDYTAAELGLNPEYSDIIKEIKQLRPLAGNQPWGIFFVNFQKKRLPVVVMRQILRSLVFKKRQSANKADRQAWQPHDLLFISAYGEDTDRAITLAHFVEQATTGLAELRVLGWDDDDTPLHMDYVVRVMQEQLHWDSQLVKDPEAWRARWSKAFVLRHRQVIHTSAELAEGLATLAKRIRARIRTILRMEDGFGEMRKLQRAFQKCLIHDLDDEGFADMFAQTVTYGLFSVSVRRTFPGEGTAVSKDDVPNLIFTSPFLKDMLGVFLGLKSRKGKIDFDDLGISDITDFLTSPDTHMEVVLADFNNKTRGEDPVIHFYEHFLEAYNKKLKIQRGVFYTPQPVVSYIVRSVHELLQTEFGLADGLADITTWGEMIKRHKNLKLPIVNEPGEPDKTISPDEPFVQILDPATGTATFIVEVIEVIYQTLTAKWKKQGRTGLEIQKLWNDYVPKHLLPRVHAFELMMAPYAIAHMKVGLKLSETGYLFGSDERARIYLTNALEPKVKQLPNYGFEALAEEAEAVNKIKWYKRFTVVIGNPPYSNFGMLNKIPFILDLLDDYKRGLDEKKLNLDDDFIKFVRLAQWQVKRTSVGIVGLITNNTYIDGITHRHMRRSLLGDFSKIYIADLHGSSSKKEVCPDGSKDENVFDIQQGVGISFLIAKSDTQNNPIVAHTDFWGDRESKYAVLEEANLKSTTWTSLKPEPIYYFFVPKDFRLIDEYSIYSSLVDIFSINGPGVKTERDGVSIHRTKDEIEDAVRAFREKTVSELRTQFELGEDSRDWKVTNAKADVLANRSEKLFKRILYRPFDYRQTWYSGKTRGFIGTPGYPVMKNMLDSKAIGLLAMRQFEYDVPDYCYFFVTPTLTECRVFVSNRGIANLFPLYLLNDSQDAQQSLSTDQRRTNFQPTFIKALAERLNLKREGIEGFPNGITPENIFHYAYAVFHSPSYRSRYSEFLKIDFPRLPLTENLELFRALARLGSELAALHLLESPKLDQPIIEFIGGRSPTMEKVSWSNNTVWIDKDQTVGFKGVREEVWNFHIGGYQVCEKWLKDRKGRTLTADDRTHYQKIIIALSETIRLMMQIDAVIEKHGGWPLK
jgi:hypothetical protein